MPEKDMYNVFFDDLEDESDNIKESNFKSLYSEYFLLNTSEKRRERLSGVRKVETIVTERVPSFNKSVYILESDFTMFYAAENRYRSSLYKIIKKVSHFVLRRFVNKRSKIKKDVRCILESGFFSHEWYAKQVNEEGTPEYLAEHYLLYGFASLLDPSEKFSTCYYLEENPDVFMRCINPLLHYVLYGKKENRKIKNSKGK